ncbi:hypothetical protein P8452_61460 [Trifolium repens]|nr:hypothetical protein P8452_61460 [Trifolium repens]
MELVRVLPSAEDEVNVACFHPFPGGGLVYETKEGKLKILHYDGAHPANGTGPKTKKIHIRLDLTLPRTPVPESENLATSINTPHDGSDIQTIMNRIQSELATSVAAAAAAVLPCTVKLRVWSHDIKNPCAPLNAERCRLTIPHDVLCSEMGAHFSPCGRYLAACVACMLPHIEADPGLQTPVHQESGIATSQTRHPITAHQVMYELRIYSLEEATFGLVLASRAIRAAHCLTSIQFSPTSEHILLAYGRRHGSLLKTIVYRSWQ